MSRAQGINNNMNKVLGLMISERSGRTFQCTPYTVSGICRCQQWDVVPSLSVWQQLLLARQFFGRIFRNFALRLLAVIFGSILYYLVLQIVIWMGIDTDLLKMLSAIVVALFLAFPYWKGKYFNKPAKRGGK